MKQNSKWTMSTGARYVYDFLNPEFYLHYVQEHVTDEYREKGFSDCIWRFVEPHDKIEGSRFFEIKKIGLEHGEPHVTTDVRFEKFELKVAPFIEQECHYIAPVFGPEYNQVIWVSAETLSRFDNLKSYDGTTKFWEQMKQAYDRKVEQSVHRFIGWCLEQNILVIKPELQVESTLYKRLKPQDDSIEILTARQMTAAWLTDMLSSQANRRNAGWERFGIYSYRDAISNVSKSLSSIIENQKLSQAS